MGRSWGTDELGHEGPSSLSAHTGEAGAASASPPSLVLSV